MEQPRSAPAHLPLVSLNRARAIAVTSAAGAVARGVCCVLPFALPLAAQSRRTGLRPSRATLKAMAFATAALLLAFAWPRLEPHVVVGLKALFCG